MPRQQPPPKFESVAEFWASYHQKVIPRHAPRVQIIECRRAFYAGVQAMLSGAVMAVGGPEVPEEVGETYLESIQAELQAFAKAVENGQA